MSLGVSDVADRGGESRVRTGLKGRRFRKAALLVLVLFVVVVVDRWEQAREFHAVLIHEERAEARMDATLAKMTDTARKSHCGRNDCWNRLAVRLRIYSSQAEVVARENNDVLEEITVVPWHGQTRAARDAYVEAGRAQAAYFERLVERASVGAMGRVSHGEATAAYAKANRRLRGALPLHATSKDRHRVSALGPG